MTTATKQIIPLSVAELPPVHQDFLDWAAQQEEPVERVITRCLYGQGGYQMKFSRSKARDTRLMQVVCGHKWYADPTMTSQGPEPAEIMIIGKCLGRDDTDAQRLLAGDAGKVLLLQLTSAGFTNQEISQMYLASAMATEPLDWGKASLPRHWLDAQSMLLMQQIFLVRPTYCLLQGSEAIKAVLGQKQTLASLELSSVQRTYNLAPPGEEPDLHTVTYVASVNPNAVIHEQRHTDSKYRTSTEQRLYKQIRYFYRLVKGIDLNVEADAFRYEVIRDTETLEAALQDATQNCDRGLIAWDAEWQGDHPMNDGAYLRCLQFTHRTDFGYVVAFTHPGGEPCFQRRDADGEWTTEGGMAECMRLCKQYVKGTRVVGHYFTADMETLGFHGLDLRAEYDAAPKPSMVQTHGGIATELMAHAWDETQKFSLDDQIVSHTDIPKYSDALEAYKKSAKQELQASIRQQLQPYRAAVTTLRAKRKRVDTIGKAYAKIPADKMERREAKRAELQQARAELRQAEVAFAEHRRQRTLIEQEHEAKLAEQSDGYGWIPDEMLYPYAAWDVAAELELARKYLHYIQSDRCGNDCTKAYWISHRASLAALEINTTGLRVDRKALDELAAVFTRRRDELLERIRKHLRWPEFNPRSKFQFAEALFGDEFNGYRQQYGSWHRYRPAGARTIRAEPMRTTGKYPMEWWKVREEGKELQYAPNTSKQTLGEMYYTATKLRVRRKVRGRWRIIQQDQSFIIGLLRDYRYVDQTLKSLLRAPNEDALGEFETDEDGLQEYDAGITTLICKDGKVRPRCRQTVETGRWALSKPSLQNQSKSRDSDLKRIVGGSGNVSARAIFQPDDAIHDTVGHEDWFFVEPDYSGAELMVTAISSQDARMIEHCQRNILPDDHPDFFDIHSNLTVQAFRLDCEPTKAGLESLGMEHLRTVGKSVVFGSLYGRGARAIAIAVRQEGVFVTEEEAMALQRAFFDEYPNLEPFFDACRRRVDIGWICNMFGRYRRFPFTPDVKKRMAYEREAMNSTIQGGVADAMSLACRNLIDYRNQKGMRYQLALQIHDAVMLHVPASELAHVTDPDNGVIKRCLIDSIPLRPCDLDGKPLPGVPEYRFGSSIDIYGHWGKVPDPGRFLRNNLSPAMVGWKEREPGVWSHKKYPHVWSERDNAFTTAT